MRKTFKIMAVLVTVVMICVGLSACTKANKIEPVGGIELSNNSFRGDVGQVAIQKADYTSSRSSTPTPIAKSIGKVIVIDPGHANRSNHELEANAPT